MKGFGSWSLTTKQVVLLLLASSLPLAVGSAALYQRARTLLVEDSIELLSARGDELVGEMEAFHNGYARSVFRVSRLAMVREILAGTPAEQEERRAELAQVVANYRASDDNLRSVALYDARGALVSTSDPVATATSIAHLTYFQDALAERRTISEVFLSRPEPDVIPLIAYSALSRDDAGKPLGVAVLYVRATALWNTVRAGNGRAGAGSFAVVYDEHGIRLAHSFNEGETLRPAGPLSAEVVARMVGDQRFGANTRTILEAPSPMPAEFERARQAVIPPHDSFSAYSPANGQDNLGIARKLSVTPWTLFYLVPVETAQEQVASLLASTLQSSALIMVVALVLGLMLSARILRPVRTLGEAARAVREGKLDGSVAVETSDELGALAASFNQMVTAIRSARDTLEERVRERTAELERANEELRAQKQELLAQREELQAQQHQLELKANEIERANALKSEFLANMSHELRTPLNSVIGFSELVLDEKGLTDRQTRHLNDVHASGRHLLHLINDILDLSKIEAGHTNLDVQAVDVGAALDEAAGVVRSSAAKKQMVIEVQCGARTPAAADPARLRQILLNLLSNAVKFGPERSRVTLTAEASGRSVRFRVRDEGPGIPASLLPRLFEPFVQGESPMVKKHQGTGLGLAISRRLVEQHGGSIELEPPDGSGASFTFTIPQWERATPEDVAAPRAPFAVRVLLVEADSAAAEQLRTRIASAGYQVTVVDNGRDALEMAQLLRPDAIVLDPAGEARDDIRTLDELKRHEGTCDIPVILSVAPGAVDVVPKPVEPERLLRELARVVARRDGTHAPVVLTVDDDPRVGVLLRGFLEPAGYRVRVATDPRTGVSEALREVPDVIVVDLMMPEMSGFEVLELLAADPRTRSVPAIVLTAADLSAEDRSYLRSRARAVAAKGTLTREELVAAIDRAHRPPAPTPPPGTATILVVDDHDLNRELARSILERRGYRVLEAADGEAAVAAARQHQPELILMDLAMPVKDGFAATQDIKADPALRRIPVVALTALAMRGDEEKARRAGFDGYVTKPINREVLEAEVARQLAPK